MPVSTVAGWGHTDLVEAVASMVAESARCPSCGLTEDQAWWVAAELERCPSCEDRDRVTDSIGKNTNRAGLRVSFTPLTDETDSVLLSSAGRYTAEGARRRQARRVS